MSPHLSQSPTPLSPNSAALEAPQLPLRLSLLQSRNAADVITRCQIAAGLKALGLCEGDRVLVHSSLVALGKVDGGDNAVIDALLQTVGRQGLVVVPTFACQAPFDRRTSATPLGAIPDTLWRRPEAFRSLHPTHSVAAIGKGAEELILDHEKQPTAYAEGTPYYKLARSGGKILLIGVDQDRNTTLHAAEAITGAPYLTDIEATYICDYGNHITIPVAAMAGPHRDFIGLDRLFRSNGAMKTGKIGKAVCRLMDAGKMLDLAIDAIRRDPAAVLCDNPACADCVMQRGKIKAARLAGEDFTLAAVAGDISDDPEEIIRALQAEGINALEITPNDFQAFGKDLLNAGVRIVAIQSDPDDEEGPQMAAEMRVPWIAPVAEERDLKQATALQVKWNADLLITNAGAKSDFYTGIYSAWADAPALAFSPAGFAAADEHPFLGVFYRGKLRKQSRHFYADDYAITDRSPVVPGQGNGEVKEIISMLRCRSYDGVLTLRSPERGYAAFRATAAAFWNLFDNM